MKKHNLKLTLKTLAFAFISAAFLFFLSPSVQADVGLTVGRNNFRLGENENLYYGNVDLASHASSGLLLLQRNAEDKLRLDTEGNLTIYGIIDAKEVYVNGSPFSGSQWLNDEESIYFNTGNVGIGIEGKMKYPLDVRDRIAINGTPVAYYPKGFEGTLIFGNAGDSLSKGSGTDGDSNTFVGLDAGLSNTTGFSNTAIGNRALFANDRGAGNTAIGYGSLSKLMSGGNNIAIGSGAGVWRDDIPAYNQDSDNSIFLGNDTKTRTFRQSNEIVIGHQATGEGSNSVVLGSDSITKTILKGSVGIGTTVLPAKLSMGGSGVLIDAGRGRISNLDLTPVDGSDAVSKNYLDSNFAPRWSVSGGNIYRLSGNVGIGTTTPNSSLHVQGGVSYKRKVVSDGNYTALADDYIIAYTAITTDRTVTLPDTLCTPGRFFVIVDESGQASPTKQIILDPEGATPIVGSSTFTLSSPYNSVYVFCGSSAWFVL